MWLWAAIGVLVVILGAMYGLVSPTFYRTRDLLGDGTTEVDQAELDRRLSSSRPMIGIGIGLLGHRRHPVADGAQAVLSGGRREPRRTRSGVGGSSRTNRRSTRASRGPASLAATRTSSWVRGVADRPAPLLVTSDTPTTRIPTQRAAIASMTVDMPDRVGTQDAQHAHLGRGLVGRTQQARVDALRECDALRRGGVPQRRAGGPGRRPR